MTPTKNEIVINTERRKLLSKKHCKKENPDNRTTTFGTTNGRGCLKFFVQKAKGKIEGCIYEVECD